VLDEQTRHEFRRQGLLTPLSGETLSAAPRARAILAEPFRLFSCSLRELQNDPLTRQLSLESPALEVEHAGNAYQIILLRPQHPPKTND
jgi:hypothetical protein